MAALGAMLFAMSASGQSADQKRASADPYWLGPFFAGLRGVEERDRTEFIYGDCKLPEGEGGCSWPARIKTSTTCALNPIAHETPFAPVSLLRGGGLRTEDEWVYVGSGYRTPTGKRCCAKPGAVRKPHRNPCRRRSTRFRSCGS